MDLGNFVSEAERLQYNKLLSSNPPFPKALPLGKDEHVAIRVDGLVAFAASPHLRVLKKGLKDFRAFCVGYRFHHQRSRSQHWSPHGPKLFSASRELPRILIDASGWNRPTNN
jgi:hypothetical protein